MEINELSKQLLQNLKEFIINNDIEISNIEELEIDTRLIGTNSMSKLNNWVSDFDFMDLRSADKLINWQKANVIS